MILDRTVYLQDNTITYDNEGIAIQTWSATQTAIRVNRQTGRNTNDAMSYNQFGLSDSTILETFFSKPNVNISEAKRILEANPVQTTKVTVPKPKEYQK